MNFLSLPALGSGDIIPCVHVDRQWLEVDPTAHCTPAPHRVSRRIPVMKTNTSNDATTLCSEKNTHSCFLLYLRGKCLNFHKIFRECLVENKYSTGGKARYSLLLVTSRWRHTFRFVNCGFYRWRQAFDEMLKHITWITSVIVLTEPKNMLICHSVFHRELFLWFIFLAECEILNFVDVGILTRTAWITTFSPSVELLDTASRVSCFTEKFCSINIQLSVHYPETSCTNL